MMDRTLLRDSWRAWWSPRWFAKDARNPTWLQLCWTFVFNSAIAVVLTLIAWGFARRLDVAESLRGNFVVSQCIGFTIHLLFRFGARLLGRARLENLGQWQRVVFYAGVPIVSVFIGYGIGLTLLGYDVVSQVAESPRVLLAIIVISLVMSAFWYRYMANKAHLAEAEIARQREQARALRAEKQTIDAQLRGLQAQIEPHFLFNTLANVTSLIDGRPADARRMLERLIELLRGSLRASRAAHSTLGQEFDLLRAYLEILSIRMGARLAFSIEAPEELRSAPLPPLLVQPLVENAIRHGLEPTLAGGRVDVRARIDADALHIEVVDSGQGFGATTSTGVGLSNLRERLTALYGARGRLTIEDAAPGTRVRISIPAFPLHLPPDADRDHCRR